PASTPSDPYFRVGAQGKQALLGSGRLPEGMRTSAPFEPPARPVDAEEVGASAPPSRTPRCRPARSSTIRCSARSHAASRTASIAPIAPTTSASRPRRGGERAARSPLSLLRQGANRDLPEVHHRVLVVVLQADVALLRPRPPRRVALAGLVLGVGLQP